MGYHFSDLWRELPEAHTLNPEDSVSDRTHTVQVFLALRHLWHKRWILVLGTLGAAALGLAYSLLVSPVYRVKAVIYPQDVSARGDKPTLGGLSGALNPLVGVGHLNRVEIVLNSREMARRVILTNRLVPVLFPGSWDASKPPTPEETSPVSLSSAIHKLQGMVSTRADVYKMTLELTVRAPSPALAFRIAQAYLNGLNERSKESVIQNAEANRRFLEAQMDRTPDPSAREKIQELIIREIETSMLLNANAFEILEAPEVPTAREWPKRKKIVLLALVVGFLLSCGGVLVARASRNLKAEMQVHAG
jgi:uncharacterized protein involved in exopolysaccharide biosynthesis